MADSAKSSKSDDEDDILSEAKECFLAAKSNEDENRNAALEDIRFARLGDQWPSTILTERNNEGRPALTINKLPAFIRQVTNEARQNKPAIKVRPVDSGADVQTAQVLTGLIRNIEQSSSADLAYDTAADAAVTGGFGYIKVDFDYAHDDSFDKDIKICAVYDQFTIYGDPHSSAADSSDWMEAFELCPMSVDAFEAEYPKASKVNWDSETSISEDEEEITLAYYWVRKQVEKKLLKLSDGTVVSEETFTKKNDGVSLADIAQQTGVQILKERTTKSYKVTRHTLSGAAVLETEEWPGIYIPIIPVYGDVINVDGKRYFHSLIKHAKDAQRQYNYWRTAATELVALAPRVPYIGPKGAFDDDPNWTTANSKSHPYLEFTGQLAPMRQPLDGGVAGGAIQQALAANDDMKAQIGLFDASLGQRSNETSGKAIMARQREGDVSTYHFIDNLSRAIRHVGRVVMDLIPKVYTPGRIVRVLGSDGDVTQANIGTPAVPPNPQAGIAGVYDVAAGKYDLTIEAGPSYTTRRVEAAEQMTAMFQAVPESAMLLGDLWAKMQDWPFADKIEERLAQARQSQGGPSPEQQKLQLDSQRMQMEAQNESAKTQAAMQMQQQQLQIDLAKAQQEIEIERQKAAAQVDIERMKAGVQMEIAQTKANSEMTIAHNKLSHEVGMRQQEANTRSEQVKNDGQATASHIGNAIADAFKNAPPLKIQMPKMKRTALRLRPGDHNSPIVGSLDEPIPDEPGTMQ